MTRPVGREAGGRRIRVQVAAAIAAALFVTGLGVARSSPAGALTPRNIVTTVIGSPGATVGGHVGAGRVDVTITHIDANGVHSMVGQQVLEQGVAGVPGASETGDGFGTSTAIGDYNGDACRDLAVGAPGEDIGSVKDVGAVWIFYGSCSTGPYFSAARTRLLIPGSGGVPGSAQAGQHFGAALSVYIVDLQYNPTEGLLIGAPDADYANARDSGEVVRLPHPAQPSSGDVLTSSQSSIGTTRGAGDRFGAALATAFSGQNFETPTNYPTFAIGAPGRTMRGAAGAGAVFVVTPFLSDYTANPHPVQILDQNVTAGISEPGDHWGASLYYWAAGNLATLVVGAPDEDIGTVADAGAVTIVPPRGNVQLLSQGANGVPGVSEPGDHFGAAINSFDDILASNSDDESVLVIGTPGEDVGAIRDAGAVDALARAPYPGVWRLYTEGANGVPGVPEAGDHFGSSFANPQFHHLLIGTPGESIGSVPAAGAVVDVVTTDDLPPHVTGHVLYQGAPADGLVSDPIPGSPAAYASFGFL